MNLFLVGPDAHAISLAQIQLSYDGYTSEAIELQRFAGQPNERQRLRARARHMHDADAIVMLEGLDPQRIARLIVHCQESGYLLMHIDAVPRPAPDTLEQLATGCLKASTLVILQGNLPPIDLHMPGVVKAMSDLLHRFERWFNPRFGWFFTNGNKAGRHAQQAAPV